MAQTIYASFPNATQCEQAAGALLDYGVRKEDISLVSHESYRPGANAMNTYSGDTMGDAARRGADTAGNSVAYTGDRVAGAAAGAVGASNAAANYESAANQRAELSDTGYRGGEVRGSGALLDRPSGDYIDPAYDAGRTGSTDNLSYGDASMGNRVVGSTAGGATYTDNTAARNNDSNADIEGAAKQGLSVTTSADASAGAAKGAGIGLGLGILAGIAALAVPGIGWVVGGGALATAIGGIIGTTVAGAIAGGVTGYLKDQGVPESVAANYGRTVEQGGAMVAVLAPSNNVDAVTIEQVLRKYGASNINAY